LTLTAERESPNVQFTSIQVDQGIITAGTRKGLRPTALTASSLEAGDLFCFLTGWEGVGLWDPPSNNAENRFLPDEPIQEPREQRKVRMEWFACVRLCSRSQENLNGCRNRTLT
jgi:hypothetical protein